MTQPLHGNKELFLQLMLDVDKQLPFSVTITCLFVGMEKTSLL